MRRASFWGALVPKFLRAPRYSVFINEGPAPEPVKAILGPAGRNVDLILTLIQGEL